MSNKNTRKNTFIEQSINIHGDKYDYSLVDYINTMKHVDIICPIHGIFSQTPNAHRKQGCKKCGISNRVKDSTNTKEDFIHNSIEVHGDVYDYSCVNYVNSKKKVDILCKKHGLFKQTPNAHISNKQGCPKCCESKGEKLITNYLNYNNIIYESQKRFNDCKYKRELPFDFFIPNLNLVIEFQGRQHYESVKQFGGIEQLMKQQTLDKIKRDYCTLNNILLLEIRYDQINKVTQILNKIFKHE